MIQRNPNSEIFDRDSVDYHIGYTLMRAQQKAIEGNIDDARALYYSIFEHPEFNGTYPGYNGYEERVENYLKSQA